MHCVHLQYRWNCYKGMRASIDKNEGGLAKFSEGKRPVSSFGSFSGCHTCMQAPLACPDITSAPSVHSLHEMASIWLCYSHSQTSGMQLHECLNRQAAFLFQALPVKGITMHAL